MNVYRKSLAIQLLMFIVFFVMAINIIIQFYVAQSFPAYSFIILGVLVLFGVGGFIYYKKATDEITVITPKELKTLKTLLYIYLFIYIGEMLLSGFDQVPTEVVKLTFGSVLIIVSLIGIYIQLKLLSKK